METAYFTVHELVSAMGGSFACHDVVGLLYLLRKTHQMFFCKTKHTCVYLNDNSVHPVWLLLFGDIKIDYYVEMLGLERSAFNTTVDIELFALPDGYLIDPRQLIKWALSRAIDFQFLNILYVRKNQIYYLYTQTLLLSVVVSAAGEMVTIGDADH